MEKGTSQFCRSAGRCGAMRHGVHAGKAKAKGAPHGHAAAKAKAKACCVHAAKAKAMAAPMGKQSRPRHTAKAMACLRGHAGMPLDAGSRAPGGTQPGP